MKVENQSAGRTGGRAERDGARGRGARRRAGARAPAAGARRPAGAFPLLAALLLAAIVPGVAARAREGAARSAAAAGPRGADRIAAEILRRSGLQRGICAVAGADRIALGLARQSELLIHVRDPRRDAVARLRAAADEAGIDPHRFTVEPGGTERLPYADALIDLVVVARHGAADDPPLPAAAEILRVLRPGGSAALGLAARGDAPDGVAQKRVGAVERSAREAGARNVERGRRGPLAWVWFERPPREGEGSWPQWEHGPDNNPVSEDRVIRAPYVTQFLAGPLYIGMPAVTTAAGGRTFLAIGHIAHHRREWTTLNRLIARNGYNGVVLWEQDLPEGYLVHRSAFIATEETLYRIDGDGCLLLDARTGAPKGRIRVPGSRGDWKWMVLDGHRLYFLAGERDPPTHRMRGDRSFGGWSWADLSPGYYSRPHIPFGFGRTLGAWDLEKGELAWEHTEESDIDSRSLAMAGGRIFLYAPDRRLACLSSRDGAVRWVNDDPELRSLIEQPGRGLTSTPGFRTACLAVASEDVVVLQGQTRRNVVCLSSRDGKLLWTKKKVTNNPNAVFLDGKLILAVGPGGNHVALDPRSGKVLEDLGFRKRSCTRLTATPDSLFCRGEGTLRFDLDSRRVFVDGAVRPACNDGALAANGLLYLGPWQCDCNLSLIGCIGKTSAGDFLPIRNPSPSRLERIGPGPSAEPALAVDDRDWPTYRSDVSRSSSTSVSVPPRLARRWVYAPPSPFVPAPPVCAGGLVFQAGDDGRVRAIDAASGELRWQLITAAPIKAAPTIWKGRLYVGSGDGRVYAVDAATGGEIWTFRAAPVERHIQCYGSLSSTWPVHSGVLVTGGTAYVAAGIVDTDTTWVWALDALSGEVRWKNDTCGWLSPELRKGVSAQGNLTVLGEQIYLAGGNQVSPAVFDRSSGKCSAGPLRGGFPIANPGRFVGVVAGRHVLWGGRTLHSSPRNVSSKGVFVVATGGRAFTLGFGALPPSWNEERFVMVNYRKGKIACLDLGEASRRIAAGFPGSEGGRVRDWMRTLYDAFVAEGSLRWQTNLGDGDTFQTVALALAPGSVIAVARLRERFRAWSRWFVLHLDARTGKARSRAELPGEPLPEGLAIDREGRVIVSLLDGRVVGFGPRS